MKFLNNGYSMNMVNEKQFITVTKEITYEEFEQIKGDYKSIISHSDLAELLNVEYAPQKVELKAGDQMLVAQLKDRLCLMDENHVLSINDYKFVLNTVYDINDVVIK